MNPQRLHNLTLIVWGIGIALTVIFVPDPWAFPLLLALMAVCGLVVFTNRCPNCRWLVMRNRSGVYGLFAGPTCPKCGYDYATGKTAGPAKPPD